MKNLTILIAFLLGLSLSARSQAPHGKDVGDGICAAMEVDAAMRRAHPKLGTLDDLEKRMQIEIAHYSERVALGRLQQDEVLTIPVILHVVHNGQREGMGPNITQEQADSQIDALNEQFRRIGSGANNNPVGADIYIEFAPALYDPDGNLLDQPGINRVDGGKESWSTQEIEATLKPSTIWNPNQYFNIWTVTFTPEDGGGTLLGYAQFPSMSGLDGMPSVGGRAETDGVVMNYITYGTTPNVPFRYGQGKTVSHEVGHWLGLRHTWGDGACGVDDFVEDTPNCSQARWSSIFLGCPTDDECGEGERMVSNYMDYSDDQCRNTFTLEQKVRMRTTMDVSPRRKELLRSTVHLSQEEPFARFAGTPTSGCEGTVVQLLDLSTNNPTTWAWTIYDTAGEVVGEYSDQNPEPAFPFSGIYSVKLVATNDQGSDSLTRLNYISIISDDANTGIEEDFEDTGSALEGWLTVNPGDDRTWESADVSAFGSGAKSIKMDNYNRESDPSGTLDYLITPLLDFSNVSNPYLTFDHAYARFALDLADTLTVAYSTDCGDNFVPIWSLGGSQLETANRSTDAFTPTDEQWRSTQVSLVDLAGNAEVHLALINNSGWGNNLYLDNIVVEEKTTSAEPSPVAIRASDQIICRGDEVLFEDNSSGWPTSWSWTFEGGTPATSNDPNPVVRYFTAGTFNVTLEVTNSSGSTTETFTDYIEVQGQPDISITASAEAICPGDEVTLTGSGAEAYLWIDERDLTPVSDESSFSLTVFEDITYTLLGQNSAGCYDTAKAVIELQGASEIFIEASDDEVCEGETVTFTASGGANDYYWLFENDTLGTGNQIELEFSVSASIGLVGIFENGCPGAASASVHVNADPVPTVTLEGLTFTSETAESYQWYLDESMIEGATSQNYHANQVGSYQVSVIDINGCEGLSEPVDLVVTGLSDASLEVSLVAYPNPTTGPVYVEVSGAEEASLDYRLSDISGRMILQGTFMKRQETAYLELALPEEPGIYLLQISDGKGETLLKLIRH